MTNRSFPFEYLSSPQVEGTATDHFEQLDRFTFEILPQEALRFQAIEFWVVLPPTLLDGKFLKGIAFSQGVDAIIQNSPLVSELFHLVADSQWCSYPYSKLADGCFTSYDNSEMAQWYRNKYLDHLDTVLLPIQQADHTNERIFKPVLGVERDIDVLCLSQFDQLGNLPLIAQGLKAYRQKYPDKPLMMTLSPWKEFDLNFKGLNESEMKILREVQSILVHPTDYIRFLSGYPHYENELPRYYSRSKILLMGNLVGEKSQRAHEAFCCNTPVLHFNGLNQYTRGKNPVFPDGTSKSVDFDPEALADGIAEMLSNWHDYKPRGGYLSGGGGRRNFFNQCIDGFSYYETNLPDFTKGHHDQNYWLDLAMQENYQRSLYDFITLTDLWLAPFRVQGLAKILQVVNQLANQLRVG
ncbi:MAG: glycosyl transferase family 1 [Cyanobacteria bacterium]|nr:glycosyl transferase family 1 [Cyanobacteriota bacterium]